MATNIQEFRERLFNAKQSSRRQAAREPFFVKLDEVRGPEEGPSSAKLSQSVIRVVGAMTDAEKAKVVGRFAITGGMAVTYHSEPVYSDHPDVLAFIPCEGSLIDLGPIFNFFTQRGATTAGEYLVLENLKF